MFSPAADGRVTPTGSIAGGHEFVADEVDAENERVWFSNSWGTGWGVEGRFFMTFADFGRLLAEQGDVTIFVPLTQPAPTPAPVVDPADRELARTVRSWANGRHILSNAKAARAVRAWLAAKGL
jgi:hypothetical protein